LAVTLAENELLIVVTHDCDVVSKDFKHEPVVETVVARRLAPAERDSRTANSKNPRRLQFQRSKQPDADWFEISNASRKVFARRALVGHAPAEALGPEATRQVSLWMGRRYTRASFPNALNERLRLASKAIDKELKAHGDLLSAVFISLDTYDELPATQNYVGDMIGTMTAEDYADDERRRKATETIDKIATAMATRGVEINPGISSESQFSLEMFMAMRRFDYDWMSEDEGDARPAAGESH
jgi:hypothetical protein